MKIGAPYTPLPLEGNALFFPSTLGGGNWGGVSVDPSLGLLFVNVMNVGQWGHMEKRGAEYVRTSAYGPYARFWNRETHVPCQNPPFGEMVAVDLASGDIAWRSAARPHRSSRSHRRAEHRHVNLGGSIATAGGLVFIGATNDSRFRAFDSKTGKVLWEAKLEASGHTSPITYLGPRRPPVCRASWRPAAAPFFGGGSATAWSPSPSRMCPRKPLPVSVSKAVAAAAPARRGRPHIGTFAPVTLPPGGAQALVEKTCGTGCHSVEVVTSQRMNAAEWSAVVQSMVARGAQASDAEAQVIVDYLSKTLGK